MTRFFAPYTEWEDVAAGLFAIRKIDAHKVKLAKRLLCSPRKLRKIMLQVVIEWPVAAKVNLTNTGCNRCAWLGQSACCFLHGAMEEETIQAWRTMTEIECDAANAVACEVIEVFVNKQKGAIHGMETK